MRKAGVELLYDCSSWGAVGLVEAIKRPQLLWIFHKLKAWVRSHRPDVVVLLDYPGFNMALTRFARELGIPTVYFFPPGKHTTRHEVVAETAKQITRVAAPLLTTYDLYKRAGAQVEFVGHPLLDMLATVPDQAAARKELGIAPESQLVGILPGSRLQEIRSHTPDLIEVVRQLHAEFPSMEFILPRVKLRKEFLERKVASILDQVRASGLPIRIVEGRGPTIMSASDALVVASGTATIEAAYLLRPMVIVYRVSRLTALLANLFYNRFPRFIGLPNILADREIVPELIQQKFVVEEVVHQVGRFFTERSYKNRVVADLLELRQKLGTPGASGRVAQMVLQEAGRTQEAEAMELPPLEIPGTDSS
jgi:lipid-A-disaccharide synthase